MKLLKMEKANEDMRKKLMEQTAAAEKANEAMQNEKKKEEEALKLLKEKENNALVRRNQQLEEESRRLRAELEENIRECAKNTHEIWFMKWVKNGSVNPCLIRLQQFWRGTLERIHRKRILKVLRGKLLTLKKRRVVRLQSLWRRYRQLKSFEHCMCSTIKIQASWRKYHATKVYKMYLKRVIILQSQWRKIRAQNWCEENVPRKEEMYLEHYDNSVRHSTEQRLQANAAAMRRIHAINNEFTDPIFLTRFVDPVTTADGHCYERASIEAWFARGHNTSPRTNMPLTDLTLRPCIPMRCIASTVAAMMQDNNYVPNVDVQHTVRHQQWQRVY